MEQKMKMRVAKFIADSGMASKRMAERLIASGAIAVNGEKIYTPVCFVDEKDVITVDGKKIERQDKTRVFAFYKPVNTITSASDPSGRKTIYEVLPPPLRNLKYVGRLDFKTTGLLLLTNDGELARNLTLPSSGIMRTYTAKLHPMNMAEIKDIKSARNLRKFLSPMSADDSIFDSARRGISIDGIKYAPMDIEVLSRYPLTIKIALREGKKNEIRIVMQHLGFMTQKLHRVSFGGIQLDDMRPGEVREITGRQVEQIGSLADKL